MLFTLFQYKGLRAVLVFVKSLNISKSERAAERMTRVRKPRVSMLFMLFQYIP